MAQHPARRESGDAKMVRDDQACQCQVINGPYSENASKIKNSNKATLATLCKNDRGDKKPAKNKKKVDSAPSPEKKAMWKSVEQDDENRGHPANAVEFGNSSRAFNVRRIAGDAN